jgi:superfamily II DNA or RNA helicase
MSFKINENKILRQKEIVNKWVSNNMLGTLIAVTGFGKTFTSILCIKKLLEINKNSKIIIVVPWIQLREQWILELKKFNLEDNIEVLIINTAYKNNYNCDLLIMDECHCYASDEFKKVFDSIKYKYLLCLTATIERLDGKEYIILDKSPIIDEVKLEECLKNNWISKYIIYNLSLELTDEEKENYTKADKAFKYAASRISNNSYDTFDLANKYLKEGNKEEKALGAIYFNSMRKRKTICVEAENKIKETLNIIEKFKDRKIIIFSETIKFASKINKLIPKESSVFHSKMKEKEKEESLLKFKNNEKRIISSVKALSAGLDIPDISLGINASGNSSKLTLIQQLGRVIRAQPDKVAIFINLYIANTQDEVWLRKKIAENEVKWIESINEINF